MKKISAMCLAGTFIGITMGYANAQSPIELLPGDLLSATSTELTPADEYKKDGPWKIGVSFGGVGNTWIVQMHQEMKYEATLHPEIGEFLFVEANWEPAKQVSDLEDMLASGVDAIIVGPISTPLVVNQVNKAIEMGIPVITFGATNGELASTVEIMGGGEAFGLVGGEYLNEKLGGKGNIWAFRGVAGVGEEEARYAGFRKGIEGSELQITNEVFADWNYAKSKQLCENLVLSGQQVDGIWFSGAESTRACIDVFKETGTPLVPMTGEGNNGFMRIWHDEGLDSAAPVFTPGLGPAVVRAAVAILEGRQLYRTYYSTPAPITNETLDQYYRPDLNDSYWVVSTLPEEELQKAFPL